jgi:hypothetical protein
VQQRQVLPVCASQRYRPRLPLQLLGLPPFAGVVATFHFTPLPHKRRIAAFTTGGEAHLLCVLQAATAGGAKPPPESAR